jgi:REP element-mobilizing transposase RayT
VELAGKMETGSIYHVFNHANGWEDIFAEERNYHYFMGGLFRRVSPAVDLHAWCLMPNHFHLAVGIPDLPEIARRDPAFEGLTEEEATRRISKAFSDHLNSYTQAFNRANGRMGSLFRQNTKWKMTDDESDFLKLVHYIHANPVHHGFVTRMEDWPHCSYSMYRCMRGSRKLEDPVIRAFGGHSSFMRYHSQSIDLKVSDVKSERRLLELQELTKRKKLADRS